MILCKLLLIKKGAQMTYKEAIAKFDNSRRKMAYALDLSTQAISRWAKNPDQPIPRKRINQIEHIIRNK